MKNILWIGVLCLPACGGGGGGGGSPSAPPPATLLSIGGGYTVAVALGANSCGDVTVQTQPTTVTQTPGANRFTLQHGPTTFQGAVANDGNFTSDPLALNDGATILNLAMQGRFTAGGFTATVTVSEDRPAPTADCSYVVQWTGTKQGAPNVFP